MVNTRKTVNKTVRKTVRKPVKKTPVKKPSRICKPKLSGSLTSGSLTNMMMNRQKQEIIPEVGMGATLVLWSDRNAYTIISVAKSGKSFTMQRDIAIRTDKNGMSEEQNYRYEENPRGQILTVSKRRDGRWKVKDSDLRVLLGIREEYRDFSF